jgi:hypothetical protein
MLPLTVNTLEVLSKVIPALAFANPLSLNRTCVFDPATDRFPDILPTTLPMKFGAVMLPLDVTVPPVSKLPPVILLTALRVDPTTTLFTMFADPKLSMLLPVTSPVAET